MLLQMGLYSNVNQINPSIEAKYYIDDGALITDMTSIQVKGDTKTKCWLTMYIIIIVISCSLIIYYGPLLPSNLK